jgi:cytochrome b561
MSLRNTRDTWGWPARALHWAMAALILFMLGLGVWMVNFTPDLLAQYKLTQIHKSFGFTVFVLALLRLGWRLANRAPDLPDAMPRWERRVAAGTHGALYVLILALPLSGWLQVSASPLNDAGAVPFRIPNMVFGLFEMPDPFSTGSQALTDALVSLHNTLAVLLAAVLALHVAGALKHHLLHRDAVLRRMIRG